MLIDEKDGDVLALSVLAKRSFDTLDLCLWEGDLFMMDHVLMGRDSVLGSTIKKFFWSCVTWPIPASRRPVIVS